MQATTGQRAEDLERLLLSLQMKKHFQHCIIDVPSADDYEKPSISFCRAGSLMGFVVWRALTAIPFFCMEVYDRVSNYVRLI